MIAFQVGGVSFQVRAAAILIDQGRLLLHRAVGDDFWSLPGGRVEAGEDSATTVQRELREELDEAVQAERLLFVVENFFAHADVACHELGFYYRCRLADGSTLGQRPQPFAGIELDRDKPLEFAWFALDELPGLTVYPEFLRRTRLDGDAGAAGPLHIVERG